MKLATTVPIDLHCRKHVSHRSSARIFCDNAVDRLITIYRLNPTDISNLITEQPKLSTDRASIYFVLFYSIVDCFKFTSHFGLRRALRFSSFREKYRKAWIKQESNTLGKFVSPSVLDEIR